jgi:4-hydroxy-4-methyl-2-oxoglutarate aldolase
LLGLQFSETTLANMESSGDWSDARTREQLMSLGSATLGESGGTPVHPRIRAVWPGAATAGPAFTVACSPGDNLAVHAAVTRAPRGSVLAVSVGDDTVRGYWGEVLTTAAEAAGIVGLVIDGTVRDLAALEEHRFPVFARGVGLRGASKTGPGTTGATIVLGDVRVASGDWIVADVDGVVAIPASLLSVCLGEGNARASKEQTFFEELRTGATTVGLLGLDVSSIEPH